MTKDINQLNFPDDYYYSKEHLWVRKKGREFIVGITDYAQDQLGEVIFIDIPDSDQTFRQGEEFGVVESTKTASELYMPVAGTILSVNPVLEDDPTFINQSPYQDGWIVTIAPDHAPDVDDLFSNNDYVAFLAEP